MNKLDEKRGPMRTHPLYSTWKGMRLRCNTKTAVKYPIYGGRGISICARWDNFWNFVSDMGPKPPGHTLDRIDNDGNYESGNCRWAPMADNVNNRRTTSFLEWNGERVANAELSRRYGLKKDVLRRRLQKGWSLEKALTTPSKPCPRKKPSVIAALQELER